MPQKIINTLLTVLFVFSCFLTVLSQGETLLVKNTDGEEIDLYRLIAEKSKEKAVVVITSFSFCDYCNALARKVKEKSREKGLDTEVVLFINGKVGEEQDEEDYGFDSYTSYKEFVKQKGVESLINVHSHTGAFERSMFGNSPPSTPYVFAIYSTETIYGDMGYFKYVQRPFSVSTELYAESLIIQLKSAIKRGVVKSSLNSGEYQMDIVYKSGELINRSIILNSDTTFQFHKKTVMEGGEQKTVIKQYEQADDNQEAILLFAYFVNETKTKLETYYEPKEGGELGLYKTTRYLYEPDSIELETEYYPNGRVCKKEKLVDGEVKSYYYEMDGSESDESIYCKDYWKWY